MLFNILALAFALGLAQVESTAILNKDTAPEVEASGILAAKEVCMKDLGCFAITDDFKSLRHRPISVLPQDRLTINTKCLLFTRQNPKEAHQLLAHDKESFDESKFDPKNPVKFIVHGFMDSDLFGPWMQAMKDEFLMHGDYNIIVVDWSSGNKPPYYQATSNTRVVGAEIALIVEALEKNTGIRREDCHIIGHSLGGHIAGYAGARLKRLGRITGCDPAEPYFQDMPKTVRLDPSDALFVDVIHSDALDISFVGFGMSQLAGHIDFFPNNGKHQPGCKVDRLKTFITEGLTEGGRRFAACNHQRSLDFMHNSINYRKVVPVGFECTDWKNFLDGKCAECGTETNKCAIMGIRADEYIPLKNNSVQRSLYLKTSAKAPFWLYHYQVTVKLFKPKTSYKDVKGNMEITLFGSKNDELGLLEKASSDLIHGARYQYLLTTDKELGEIKSVSLKWKSTSKNPIDLIKKPSLYVEYITVVSMNEIEKTPRDISNRVYCDKPKNGIAPRTQANFNKNSACLNKL